MNSRKKILLFVSLAAFLLVGAAIAWIMGYIQAAGWLLVGFFLSLAAAIRYNRIYRGLSFTAVMFAAVAVVMFHPAYFISWGNFSLSGLIVPLIQLLMFGMGSSMSVKDFAEVIKSPKGVFIGVACHFIIMPLLGVSLASITRFPSEVAAGIILIGCSPSGLASNVMAYLAKANLPLSITVTSISTLLAPVITPLLMKLFAGTLIQIDVLHMMWDISKMIFLPIGAGLLFNKILKGKVKWLDDIMPLLSMFSIICIVCIITAAGRDNLLKMGALLILVALVHNLLGYLLGYMTSRLFRLPEADCRTIAIEVGMQNAGLASGIAKQLGKITTLGLASAVFGPLMNITGSILASWWHNRPTTRNDHSKQNIEPD